MFFAAMTVVQFLVVLFVYPETKGSRWRICSGGWYGRSEGFRGRRI